MDKLINPNLFTLTNFVAIGAIGLFWAFSLYAIFASKEDNT